MHVTVTRGFGPQEEKKKYYRKEILILSFQWKKVKIGELIT